MNTIYDRIERRLQEIEMNKRQLSDLSGMPYSTLIAAFNRGSDSFSFEYLGKIASVLGVDVNYLLHGNISFIGFGRRMEGAREAAKLSQQELADKTDITIVDIQAHEDGERKPAYENAEKIAEALNVSINFLSLGNVTTQREYEAARLKFGDETWPEKLEDVDGHGEGYLRVRLPGEGEGPREVKKDDVIYFFNRLNAEGRAEYVRFGEILSKVPDYQRKGR